jgi:uncharacterized membrane protein SirB2
MQLRGVGEFQSAIGPNRVVHLVAIGRFRMLPPMNPDIYFVLHVFSAILLVAFTFQAIAAPVEVNRRRLIRNTGILSVLLFVAGMGLLAKGEYENMGWFAVKILCAIVLAGLTPMAFKRPERAGRLTLVAMVVVAVAVSMVYFKPF